MKRTITVMNYLEVVGSIAHMCNTDYKDFFEQYKGKDESERECFVFDSVNCGSISDVESVSEDMADFLNLPSGQYWFISTWNQEYVS